MSLILEYLEKHPKEAKRLIGITAAQFQELSSYAEILSHEKSELIEKNKVRINQKGAGCKPKLSVKEQVLLTLVYLSQLHTFQYLGIQFEVSESTAHNIFHKWVKILGELLPATLLEQFKKKESDYELIKEILTQYELIVDSAEQHIERPSDYQEQKKFYSGKKKAHTRKNQFIVLPEGKDIVDVTVGDPGPKSDINQLRERQKEFSQSQKFRGDKAYIGAERTSVPQKKPKNSELTQQQKEQNKKSAQQRIYVEHMIRLVKIFRIAKERFRLRPESYNKVILIVCGLVRLRIGALVLSS